MNWFRKDCKFTWITADQDQGQLVEEILSLYYNNGEQTTNEPEEGMSLY